jgi:hypothetical protein
MKNRKNAKIAAIAVMAIFIGAIFAAAWSIGAISALPVKVTPLAGGTDPVTTLKLLNGTPVVNGWNTTTVNMNLTAVRAGQVDNDDRIAGIWYRLDTWNKSAGAWVVGTWTNYSVTNLTRAINLNGTIRINYNASDHLDDETTQTKIVMIDMTAPTTTATITGGTAASNGWYKSQVNITLKADNDTDMIVNKSGLKSTTYQIGAVAAVTKTYVNQTDMAAGIAINVSAQGITLVNYSSKDNATNEALANVTVKIDSVAPTMTLPAAASTLTGMYFNWTGTDASSGIDHYLVSVNGAAATTVTPGTNGSGSVLLTVAGSNNVTVTAVDVAGNEVTQSVTVTATAAATTDYTMYIIIIVIIVVVVVVAVLMLRKGKGKVAEAPAEAEEKSS